MIRTSFVRRVEENRRLAGPSGQGDAPGDTGRATGTGTNVL
jgi:hypothetical protein